MFQNVFSKSIVDPLVFGTCTNTFSSFAKVTISNTLFMVFIEVKVVKTLTQERSSTTLEVNIVAALPSFLIDSNVSLK